MCPRQLYRVALILFGYEHTLYVDSVTYIHPVITFDWNGQVTVCHEMSEMDFAL